jgi:hypothetical protein
MKRGVIMTNDNQDTRIYVLPQIDNKLVSVAWSVDEDDVVVVDFTVASDASDAHLIDQLPMRVGVFEDFMRGLHPTILYLAWLRHSKPTRLNTAGPVSRLAEGGAVL